MVLHSLSCLGSFFCLFWRRCQIPRLGVSSSSAPAFRVWVLFFCLFWGRCQIPRMGVSCSSGAAFRVCVVVLLFRGRCQIPCLGASCSMSSKSPTVLGFKSPTDMRAASIIIYYLDWRDSSWWTWFGQTAIWGNGMGISTKWFFSFVSFHCDCFMNSTSQPLQNGSCDFETFFWHLYQMVLCKKQHLTSYD